jgi:hypothetical protein
MELILQAPRGCKKSKASSQSCYAKVANESDFSIFVLISKAFSLVSDHSISVSLADEEGEN